MAHLVNLDALIPREDFDVDNTGEQSLQASTIQIRNLEPDDFFYTVVRKPDFQRETSDWSPEKICGFVESFLEGDLIPALILWQAGSQIFVIDGAHRLSAVIAWVHDDYGDSKTSRNFFDGIIPDDQISASDHTRRLIKRRIGSYVDHKFAIQNPEKVKPELLARAKRLGSLAIQLQWVKGDATKAEESFFKINQQASPIDKTELRLLKCRRLPNALAARAIIRSGTGHKYWSLFPDEMRREVEAKARIINELLFSPSFRTPIKTLDLPVAGRGYSSKTLPLVFELVNLVNAVKNETKMQRDDSGEETLRFLKKCQSTVNRLSGVHASSLGLHPAVYFYSATGRYQPTAFMAMVALMQTFEEKDLFRDFTRIRRKFESFLLDHRILVNQVTVKYGSGSKGYARLHQLLYWIVERFINGYEESAILKEMALDSRFSYLQPAERPQLSGRQDFDSESKSAVFLRDALRDPLRCSICGGLIHLNGISIDHVVRKSDGGKGSPDNGQLTHPYCNTTIKN
ncbi:HNH endonuclease [Luteolibacter sp. GHJ8]|uniref:HNH endonuclease n=1 Tax=Luteolibacter rhizosphaerae TaxID=2989719 RepID=A0ABT3G9Z1_9BACT|nr:HNH endonuclease [Luteolibacter rhizosphaerae]MCW1916321.1 HNH endonuclease [Luteolibacter rhizosphaerae]